MLQALKNSNYSDDPMLQECGVRIGSDFTQVEGRLLPTPKVTLLFPFLVMEGLMLLIIIYLNPL